MAERNELHPRNKHNGQYDFGRLIADYPALEKFVAPNPYGNLSINFFDPQAVKALNKALLKSHYGITYWDIPRNNLCPPIPGRADYIHYLADLIGDTSQTTSPSRILDIGVGANCIYPIIGCIEYGWMFVGSDIDTASLANARKIATCNPVLAHRIELRLQTDKQSVFKGIIAPGEQYEATLCNPPFHSSPEEAQQGTLRKLSSLKGKSVAKAKLNFGGNANELWCEGGELSFLIRMIDESRLFGNQCKWFTTLVSKAAHLETLYAQLQTVSVAEYKTIHMQQGTKTSRILAWRF